MFFAILIVYNYLFWKESAGVNLPLFSLLMGISAALLNPGCLNSRNVLITAAGTFITGLMVIFRHSQLSVAVHVFSFFVMLGFMQQHEMKSIYNAFFQSLSVGIAAPKKFFEQLLSKSNQNPKAAKFFRLIRLVLLPLILFFLFYFIYVVANPLFDKFSLKFTLWLQKYFDIIFKDVSFSWLMFMLLGVFIAAAVIFRAVSQRWAKADLNENENLERTKSPREKKRVIHLNIKSDNPVALLNEKRSGIIFLVLINILLLIVNCIDINWIWFGFYVPEKFNLKQFVHEGTYLLIFSILLSMAILLYLFRKNQNFLKNNKTLKTLSYLWIVQNVVLCISVFLRNYHYINYHGLAYKRIGVVIFLLLTFIGLVTLFIKIRKVKSLFFLLRKNSWALYFAMVSATVFNWETIIVRYNLNHWNSDDIDTDFYLSLSVHSLPELLANEEKVKRQMELHQLNPGRWVEITDYDFFEKYMLLKKEKFMEEFPNKSWQSWNYADAVTYAKLKNMKRETGYLK